MLISLSQKFIFIATLKTASTAIEDAFGQYAEIKLIQYRYGKHMTYKEIENRFSWLFADNPLRDFVCFGVIRDPVDFVLSLYNSHRKKAFLDQPHLYTGNISFEEFRKVWVNVNRDQMVFQSDRFVDRSGKIGANYVATYDRLHEGLNDVSLRLGIPFPQLRISNQSPSGLTRSDLTTEDMDWCYQCFEQDFVFIDKYCNRFFDFDVRPEAEFSRSFGRSFGAVEHDQRNLGRVEDVVEQRVSMNDRPSSPRLIDLYERMGLNLMLDQSSLVDRHMITSGTWEPEQLAYLSMLIERLRGKPNATFLDIGSYWGLYSLLALKSSAFDHIHAFEADLHNFAQLHANLFLNNAAHSIKAHNKAVSDKGATLRFWDSRTHIEKNRGGVGVVDENSRHVSYAVEAVSIDDFQSLSCAHILAKIDVEGHEERVLKGMAKTISQNKIVLQVEIFKPHYDRIFAETERLGLRKFHEIYPDHYLTNMTIEELGT